MLQKTSEEVADCLRHAAEVDAYAESTNDAKRKAEYQRIAQSWRTLARSFDFQETLGRFISFDESTKNASSDPPLDIAQAAEPAPRNHADTVLANTPFFLTRCSSDLRYVFASEAYAQMLGHRPEDLVGKKIVEVIGQEAFQTILPYMNAVLTGRRVEYEKEVHYKETGRRLVHVIYTPDRDELGHVVGWVASIIDVTNAADLHSTMLLRDVSSDCVRDDATLDYCLHRILDAGITIAKAQKGTLQLLDPLSGTLRIATQRGFGQPFLDFFKDVSPKSSTCGAALQTGGRIIVENVLTSEIFVDQPSQEVLLNEDVSAVISTPLISSHRHLLGMLSTHFREPHQPQGRELHLTDLLTRLAADYLERKQGRENERLLLREIQHRSNNLLSVVQAISQNTFSRAKPFGQAKRAFEGRLLALAECNKLITNSMIGRIPLREIVCLQVEPFASRIALDGSELTLSSQRAQAVSLLLHELITNAAKHGALKEPSGNVAITWIVDRSRHVLQLKWKEQGGPPVVPPRRTGFGTKLLKATFPAAQVDYVPDGVHCQIEIPITP